MISLHRLRIFLDETYEMTIDRLEVIPPIPGIIGLEPDDLLHPSTLNEWLDRIVMGGLARAAAPLVGKESYEDYARQ